MTERAAGNGYSWWWASHIRTKQTKWLEQNLQDDDDYTVGPSKLPKKPSKKQTKTPKANKIPKPPKLPAKGALNNYISKEKLSQDSKLKQQRFDEAKSKLDSLKHKFNLDQSNNKEQNDVELGDTIDKLVNKMIKLETSVVSQTTVTDTLTKQNSDLQNQIQTLEAEKALLMNNLESKVGKKDEVNWLNMLLNGLEDKDDILLQEYITILKSYRDTKRTLSSMKSEIVKRDDTIHLLVQKLKHLQASLGEDKVGIPSIDFLDESQLVVSTNEDKLRADFDTILNQNLDLWLNFSNTFRQVYKFKTQVKDLLEEVKRVKEKGQVLDIKPVYKHLKEINVNLTVWLHDSTSLKDELDTISSCLSKIHEEITQDGVKFSAHEAAKFKGEIWNMKQDNNKVNEELEAGLHHAIVLKHEIEQTLERLEMEFDFSANQNQPRKGRSSKRPLTSHELDDLIVNGTLIIILKLQVMRCEPRKTAGN
ncbi:hypothetical protein L1987_74616 [Smallanthus sonchifolius]|uniref:Uncharacterized protein n=1 Tax=Smallanthus sonchifolius TaxID=185202 RepID=A0ACB9A3J2_9ASTR|nr:hypothetical protein L1987_74616 [Smallanthus sonchifolius]